MNTMKEYTLTLPENYTPPPLPGRDEWITALRSGDYKQGKSLLKFYNSYCCLGVLCDLQGRLNECFDGPIDDDCGDGLNPKNPLFDSLEAVGSLPDGALVYIGKTQHALFTNLANLNDFGLSFSQIADIIEQVWSDGGPLPKEQTTKD